MTDLQNRFEDAAEWLRPGPAPIAAIRERGTRLRRRRRVTAYAGGAALVVVALVAAVSLRPSTDRATEPVQQPSASCPAGAYVLDGDVDAVAADCTATTIAHDVGDHARAELSPDATTVAYATYTDGVARIRVVDLSTGRGEVITGLHNDEPYSFTWSPDSSRLAYLGEGLHLVDLRSGDDEALDATARGTEPTWSPDGSRVAFVAHGTDSSLVAVEDLHTTRRSTFVDGTDGDPHLPVWSPDGTRLLSLDLGGPSDGVARPGVGVHRVSDGRELARAPLPGSDIATTTWEGRPTLVSEPDGRTITLTSYDDDLTDPRITSFTVPEVTQPDLGTPATDSDLHGDWTARFAGDHPAHLAPLATFDTTLKWNGEGFDYLVDCEQGSLGLHLDDGVVTVPGSAAASVPTNGGAGCVPMPSDELPDVLFQVARVYADGDRLLMTSITGHVLLTLTRA